MIETERLTLRPWDEADRAPLAAMHADAEVMADYGGVLSRAQSDAKFDRYVATFERHGFSRWAVEDSEQLFLGYAGVRPSPPDHPLGPHAEIGWRLTRSAWGQGYATEAARAVRAWAFDSYAFPRLVSFIVPTNARSIRVAQKLGAVRDGTAALRGVTADIWVHRRPDDA